MGNSSFIKLELSDAPFIMNLGILNIWFCFVYQVIDGPHTVVLAQLWLTSERSHPTLYYIFLFSMYVFWENIVDTWETSFHDFLDIPHMVEHSKNSIKYIHEKYTSLPRPVQKMVSLSVKAPRCSFVDLQNCVPIRVEHFTICYGSLTTTFWRVQETLYLIQCTLGLTRVSCLVLAINCS